MKSKACARARGCARTARFCARAAWWWLRGRSARTSCCSAAALNGSLGRVSARLGELVRTNSESILTVTVPEDYPEDLIKRVAISSSIYPDPNTHIETVTYGDDGNSMHRFYTLLVGDGTRVTRPLKLARPDRAAPQALPAGAVPQALVAAHDHRARDADARQRDRAAPAKRPIRLVLAADRTGSRAAQPDIHPGREPSRGMVRQAHRRDRAELGDGGAVQHPDDRAHPWRRGDRPRSASTGSSMRASRCSATRTCSSAMALRSRQTWV